MNRKHIPFNCLNICLAEVIFANPMSDVIITIELGLNPRWPTNLENTLLLSQDITRAKEDMEVLKQNIQLPFERSFKEINIFRCCCIFALYHSSPNLRGNLNARDFSAICQLGVIYTLFLAFKLSRKFGLL